MEKQKDHDFMNAYEVSGYLRIPLGSVYRLTYDGKIKAVKIGKHWRYLRSDIERYSQFGTDFSTEPARKSNDFFERRAYPRINSSFDCKYSINLTPIRFIQDTGIIMKVLLRT